MYTGNWGGPRFFLADLSQLMGMETSSFCSSELLHFQCAVKLIL